MTRLLLPVLFSSLAATLTSAQGLGAQGLKVGDDLPPIVLEGLSQTEAVSFADFTGRAVLLEFFAHWCGPCAASVPHLNELQEKYGPRGFSVVAVTSESAKKTDPWIEKHGARYAYGYDKSNELSRLFQIKSIPFSALIDPLGTVVWTGHPARLSEQEVERALAGALTRPVWQWPAEMRPLAALVEKGDFAAALRLAATLPVSEELDPQAFVRSRFEPLLAKFAELVEEKDYGEALELAARLETGLAGLPEGEQVAARARELRADPEIARQVAAAEQLSAFEARASALKKPAEAEKLRAEVAALLEQKPGERVERRARQLLEALDRALERVRQKPG